MIVFKKRVKFVGKKTDENTFISQINNRMYSDAELRRGGHIWIKETKKFKNRVKAGIIISATENVKNIDSDLAKIATDLDINFDDSISQSVLEDMVRAKQEEILEEKEETKEVQKKEETPDVPRGTDDELEEKRTLVEKLQAKGVQGASVKWKLDTLKAKLAETK